MTFVRLLPLPALLLCLLGCSSTTPQCDAIQRTRVLPVVSVPQGEHPPSPSASLTLVSINLAHGRQKSPNQLLVGKERTYDHLNDIAEFFDKYDADVVALQEADSPSPWSGGFDHVAYLAQQARFPLYVYSEHAQLWMGSYGTAILSKLPIESALGLTFTATPPTANKGFTLAQIRWATGEDHSTLVDVVSVHLDFSRESMRIQQLDELVAVLKKRDNPLVLMGDFNSERLVERYLLDRMADKSALHVYQASDEALSTYKDKRLDWILLTKDLVFDRYQVASESLSDHRAVVARIRFRRR